MTTNPAPVLVEGKKTVTLSDLIGLTVLDAVDFDSQQIKAYDWSDDMEDCAVCRFRLNGTVYVAVENPDDGYRSSMREIVADPDAKISNSFPGIRVLARHKNKSNYNEADILELIDVVTGKVVLEVGTDNSDDYYPSFIANFCPENMATNSAVNAYDPNKDALIAELVGALKDCRAFFDNHMGHLFGPDHDIPTAAGASLAISTIEMALARAENRPHE